jgi:hypothetical protein
MLTKEQAEAALRVYIPNREIEFYVEYDNNYIFLGFDDNDEQEGQFDPFYSVSKITGRASEFAADAPGVRVKLTALWAARNGIDLPT